MHLRTRTATVAALSAALACLASPSASATPAATPRVVEVTLAPAQTSAAPAASEGSATDDVVVADMDVVVPRDIAQEPTPTPTPTPTAENLDVPSVSASDGTVVADVVVSDGRTATSPVETGGVQTLGVTWPDGEDGAALDVQVRTQTDDVWSAWVALDPGEAPDATTTDAAHSTRGGTDSFWLGDAEVVQVSFAADAAVELSDLDLALVGSPDGGTPAASSETTNLPAPAPAPGATPTPTPTSSPESDQSSTPVPTVSTVSTVSTAWVGERTARPASRTVVRTERTSTATSLPAATPTPPRVISRAEWGAPAQVCAPDVASGLVGAVVHHTAGSNDYTTVAEAMQQIRNDAAYHIQSRGWCDIGYNFVVDKWGNIYEGRAGSLSEPVIGVHAGGFNTGTVGVAMLGTYDAAPSQATQIAVGRIIGWRLGAYRVDPRGTMNYWTGVGENSRFQNQTVTVSRVMGHRDVAYTACPGNGGYAALAAIRNTAWDASVEAWAAPPSSLLRTASSSTVYLVSGGTRYPIDNMATLGALSPLGPVAFVSQQYLDAWTVGPKVKRVLLQPDGTVSFFDAGIRLSFSSCAQVADYGLTCGDAVRIDATQTASLHNGGRMANLYRTTSGKAFYVSGGAKHEVADDMSLMSAGLPSTAVWLLESGIAYLPYGDPVVRTGLMLHERGGAVAYQLTAEGTLSIPDPLRVVPGVPTNALTELDAASIRRLPSAGQLAPLVRDSGGTVYFLSVDGKHPVADTAAHPPAAPLAPASILQAIPSASTIRAPFFLKGDDDGTVYVVRQGLLRAVRSWPDLIQLNGGDTSPTIVRAGGSLVRLIPSGGLYNPPGMLAKTATDGTVYLLDGSTDRIPVSTFAVTAELGADRLAVVPDAEITGRAARSSTLRTIVECSSRTYIGLGGLLWEIPSADRSAFPATASTLAEATCAALPHADRSAPRFWLTKDGTIYYLTDGVKRPIGSYGRYLDLGGTNATTLAVSDFAASQVPTGARL